MWIPSVSSSARRHFPHVATALARLEAVGTAQEVAGVGDELLSLLELIRDQDGTVQGVCTYCAQENEYLIVTLRVEGVDKYNLKQGIRNLGFKVIDIR